MTYNWRELLYPAEWGFRFIIVAQLVALISFFSGTDYVLFYYLMWSGCTVCFLLQLRIAILFIQGRIPATWLSNA